MQFGSSSGFVKSFSWITAQTVSSFIRDRTCMVPRTAGEVLAYKLLELLLQRQTLPPSPSKTCGIVCSGGKTYWSVNVRMSAIRTKRVRVGQGGGKGAIRTKGERERDKGVARFTPATTTAQDWNATVADTKLAEPANCFTTCRFGTARAS